LTSGVGLACGWTPQQGERYPVFLAPGNPYKQRL